MKMLLGCSLCLLVLLGWMSGYVESGTLHLDSCSVSVHTHELRKYYSAIRTNAVMTSICLSLQEGQTCCFLRLVLRFYVERVFSNYVSSQPTQQRSTSALANAFVSIRRDIHKCHCQCAEETQKTIDSLHAEFDKLVIDSAAQKAMGELDTVLEWLEAQKTHA
uniref:Interleukin family protein n=1 Tax=Labrus bergylta TaxID=56723 RepID=A0A3Q3FBR2_9LABR